jgi:ribosomal protein L12E/L44/L45/RPP1/RPP2
VKATVYLIDRILGRSAGAAAAPADDRRAPYTEEDFQEEEEEQEDRRSLFGMIKRKADKND